MVMEMEITTGTQTIQQTIESNVTVIDVTSDK